MNRSTALSASLVAVALALPGIGHAASPVLELSWNAPHGARRAATSIRPACQDSARVDTLWLTYDPGESSPKFYGVYARLYFHPAEGDTLEPFWHFKSGAANQKNLSVEFAGDDFPVPPGWNAQGMGQPIYEFTPSAGRLDLIYAVAEAVAAPIEGGRRYALARIMIRHRRTELAGCDKPMCIEWALARLGAGQVDRPVSAGPRFVSWNATGDACTPWRTTEKPSSWAPPKHRSPGAPAAVPRDSN